MLTYKKAVLQKGKHLKSVWGALKDRTRHWAEKFLDAVLDLRERYPKVPRSDIIRDLRNVIGGMSVDTLEDYCNVVGTLRAFHIEHVFRHATTGFSHLKEICNSGLPNSQVRAMILEYHNHNKKPGAHQYTVREVKTKIALRKGEEPTAVQKRLRYFHSPAAFGLALKSVLDAGQRSATTVEYTKSHEFMAARQLQETLLNSGEGPLFS